MKKFLIILSSVVLALILLVYLGFLITPLFVNQFFDFDKYKADVQKTVKESTKLNLDYGKIRIYTTLKLGAGVIINDAEIQLDDKTTLFKASKIKGGLDLKSLVVVGIKTAKNYIFDKELNVAGVIRTSKCYMDNPYINLEIVNDEQYKIVKLVEQLINENNKKDKKEEQNQTQINIDDLKYVLSNLQINNYEVQIKDLKTKNYLKLYGEKLLLGYDGKNNFARIETLAKLNSNEKENIVANLKIKTALPELKPTQQEELDPEEKVKLPFINIVKMYQKYDLKANILSDLTIYNLEDFRANGIFSVDDLTLKLSNAQLPNSYFHSKFSGKKINYDSNIYATRDEKISLLGFVKFSNKPHLNMELNSDEIHFKNILILLEGLLDSFNIKNELNKITTTGYLKANAKIDTNFKKLKSNGLIEIVDGSFVDPASKIGIKNLTANFVLDGNALKITNSKAVINNAPIKIEGAINNKSYADIHVNIANLSIPELYNAFLPKEIKNNYKLTSLKLTTDLSLKGQLEALNVDLCAKLNNLGLNDRAKTFVLTNASTNVFVNFKEGILKGKIANNSFGFTMPSLKTTATIDKILIDLSSDDIKINPFNIIYNQNSNIKVDGDIKNYSKKPDINIFIDGNLSTANILKTLGNDIAYYVPAKGNILFKTNIKGNDKKQDILTQIYANGSNYISPIILDEIRNQASIIQANISIKGNKIKIKDSGLFKTNSTFSNELEKNLSNSKKIIDFTTIIEGNHINLLRINFLKELTAKISIFSKSSFKTQGKINATGTIDNLFYAGDLKISDLKIPELLLEISQINIHPILQDLFLDLKDINLNGSKLNIGFEASLKPAKIVKISNLNINSNEINVDKAMEVSTRALKYVPVQSSKTQTKSNSNANIPLGAQGSLNIKKLQTGEIIINNIKSRLSIRNNNLYLQNLTCNAFSGNVNGSIVMNLINSLLTIRLNGNKINADEMLLKAANMKDTLSGTLEFNMAIQMDGAASTYQAQMKSLLGNLKFKMINGQYGPFSKLENFFLAENIRENPVFKNTIGVILTPLATIDSSHYEVLEGKLGFKNGVVTFLPITSKGNVLCLLIKGHMNLITNEIDSVVRVRLASMISDMLGPLAMANPINLVKNTPGLNLVTAKLFTFFTTVVTENDYKEIPDFSSKHSDNYATKFQIYLKGDVAKPLKLVKSFKWLALQKDMEIAEEVSDSYVKEQAELAKQALMKKIQTEYEQDNKMKVGVQKVLGMDTTAPQVKEMLVEEVLKTQNEASKKAQELIEQKASKIPNAVKDVINTKIQSQINNVTQKALESINKEAEN